MAFLCPIRVKRTKKKKPLDDESLPPPSTGPAPSMGRITGSASIETLVRVGIEKENGLGPESKMVVLHDFTPCVDDELEVKRGQIVHVLYQENDWVYVISSDDNQEGFIPHSYCAQFGSQLAGLALNEAEAKQSKRSKKKLPRDPSTGFQGGGDGQQISNPSAVPQTMMATAQVPASSSTSTASSIGGPMVSLRSNLSDHTNNVGGGNQTMMGSINEAGINSRMGNNPIMGGVNSNSSQQQVMDFRSLNTIGKLDGRSNSKTSTNSTGKGADIGHSDDTGGEDDSFEPRDGNSKMFGSGMSNTIRQSGVFRGESQNDPSRSNSLMSENSSQPDMHPFYKEATGRYVVLYNYTAQDENDLTVERGQCVTVLNSDDPDWFWVSQFDGRDGFVPSGFIYPLDAIQRQQNVMNDNGANHHQRGSMQNNNSRVGQINNYPDAMNQIHFSNNNMVGSPKGGNSSRMFQGPNKTMAPGLPSSHLAPPQPSSNNVLHQVNNSNISSQPHSNPPWSNGSAGSSGPPSFNNNSGSFAQSNSTVSGIFSATAANAVVGVSNSSMAGDLLHLGVGSSAATFSAINHNPSIQHPSQQPPVTAIPSPQKPTPISSTSSASGHILGMHSKQPPLSTHPSMSPSTGSHMTNSTIHQASGGPPSSVTNSSGGDVCYNGTELVMLYDYKAQAPDDLSVRRGDWVYADLNNQTVDGWLWSYAPKTRKYGFIPKAYARPPAMTSL